MMQVGATIGQKQLINKLMVALMVASICTQKTLETAFTPFQRVNL